MSYGAFLLEWGNLIGVLLLAISTLIYAHVYAVIIREMKRLTLRHYLILLMNSYVFSFGLLCLLMANGWL
ncbi:MAG: hypothetical protein QXH55_00995 [Candidatus Korarchaeota archaeon]|nr:hypothetical protein [Thermoproteota archaeon]MCR8487989.1 hypothetical protein [Thermoproteota archaeon]